MGGTLAEHASVATRLGPVRETQTQGVLMSTEITLWRTRRFLIGMEIMSVWSAANGTLQSLE